MAVKRQGVIPATERKVNKKVAGAGRVYLELREAHAEATKKLKDAKTDLIQIMKETGETTYRDDSAVPPILIVLRAGSDDVKVTKLNVDPDDDGSDDEGGDEAPEGKPKRGPKLVN